MMAKANISGSVEFRIRNQTLQLLPQKAIFWQEEKTLLLADLHLGKAGHFRKAGIPVPTTIHQDDLRELDQLIQAITPSGIFLLGDVFHSEYNAEWRGFEDLLASHSDISFTLVRGNHDILPPEAYHLDNLVMVDHACVMPPFVFTHKPAFELPFIQDENFTTTIANFENYYNLAGHIHPGVSVAANAGQHFKMPCFYFTPGGGILPAFGKFTGFKCLKKHAGDRIFGIAGNPGQHATVFRIP